jgi:hypothetical protein
MHRAAVRLNNYAASLIVGLSGKYIKYPEISWDNRGMFTVHGLLSFCYTSSYISAKFATK